ncbi:MAG: DNA primase [Acidobacteriaceae bacterium]|nr:DNA primase [Acidobacteriaceae bacterium]MBV9778763.1 DNA primase [Acidobacteriaceae bacterium]
MNFAEQLKGQLDIVEVVGQYVRLKRSGAGPRYVGLCPFHSEKTPSFGVHSVLQFYKCFGCDAGGDVFKFVMEIENLTFPEALKFLAERYGIPIPERRAPDDPETQRRDALLEMHEIAAQVFQENLRGRPGAEARSYLESRGVSRESIDEFRLGLSDASGQQLHQKLRRFGPALLEESGLIVKRQDDGGFYDRFRSRLMFPIHTESGKVVAFGGRALRAGDEPKYLNSPETKIYKKSSILYNLHRAKVDARKQNRMILVEGYMDVIGIYSASIHEVVASCGTSLTIDQVRSIKRQIAHVQASTGQIVLNYDADDAGVRSTEKYIATLLSEGLRVKVMELPNGIDADEYIQQHGADAYRRQLDEAASYFHWLAARARERFDMNSAEGRVDAFKFMVPSIRELSDPVERGAVAREAAELLGVDREAVREHLRRAPAPASHNPAKRSSPILPPNEKLLLNCVLLSADARCEIKKFAIRPEILNLLELRSVFEAWLQLEEEGVEFSLPALTSRLDPRLARIVTDLSFSELGMTQEDALDQALHCLRALEAKAIDAARSDLRHRIRELEKQGNFSEAFELMNQFDLTKNASSGT